MKIIKYEDTDVNSIVTALRREYDDGEVMRTVSGIVGDVRARGDDALFEYTKKYDKQDINADNIIVTEAEIDQAYKEIPDELLGSLRRAIANVRKYQTGLRESFCKDAGLADGAGNMVRPVRSAGLYVPGGKAAYPSSVYMCAVPAAVAGVQDISIVTPPCNSMNPLLLAAARECGVHRIYKVGGAQSIAALAYGTQSIKKVDMICGPGNIYVTAAKKLVFGECGIDMLAGPSEILIIADDSADPGYVAADLLSQAEHDERARAILVTTSAQLAHAVSERVDIRLKSLPRAETAAQAINDSFIICAATLQDCIDISNAVAPEHLELMVRDAGSCLPRITSAGAVFLGKYSPEPLGDYFAGPSHVLPTGGTARFFSPLSAETFLRKISLINYTEQQLWRAKDDIIRIAECEGLTAHAGSAEVRFTKDIGEKIKPEEK